MDTSHRSATKSADARRGAAHGANFTKLPELAEVIERELREYAPGAEIHFERLAVTREQIRDWRLPSRPTKTSDMRAAAFGNRRSVELDAINPNRLRKLVEDAINRHMPKKLYTKLTKAEQDEQDEIRELVDQIS